MSSCSDVPAVFRHQDADGDKLEAFETDHGTVFHAWGTDGDYVAIAFRAGQDTQDLINFLVLVQEAHR
jgi:hypothetical protein